MTASEDANGATKRNYNFDLSRYSDGTSIHMPAADGLITDWDWLERVWDNSMSNVLRADSKDTPVMMTEKVYNTSSYRRRCVTAVQFCRAIFQLTHYSFLLQAV